MGCSQSQTSSVVANNMPPSYSDKWATTTVATNGIVLPKEIDQPPPEFREDLSQRYQDVLDLSNMMKMNGTLGGRINLDGIMAENEAIDALLQKYKEYEERIRSYEKEDPLILFYVKQSRLENLAEIIERHEEMTDSLKNRVMEDAELEGANGTKIRTLRSALIQAGNDAKISKEAQDAIARKNQLEIATTELEMLFQEKAIIESDIQELKVICTNLTQDYKRQEEIAAQLSVNPAGRSELELLDELANVETRRITVSEVFERWKEARVQIADSCRQFSSALEKWSEMKDDSVEGQFDIAEEVRDELITSLQFLSNGRFYVQHEFPYCTKQEISILNKALTYIFVDMQTDERRKHAENCYSAFHNRAVALYAWIDTTLKAIIQPVVLQTAEDLRSIMEELQEVRFQSIKHQFPNVTWQHSTKEGDPLSSLRLLERSEEESPNDILADNTSVSLLEQLDLSQLAPLPRTADIFGKPTKDLVESYKTTLRESMAKEVSLENRVEELVIKRKESLKEQDLVEEDTVGLA